MNDLVLQDLGKQLYEQSESAIQMLLQEEQVPCPVVHRFGPGLYIREIHFPAGTIAIGHEQRYEQLNIFIKGKVQMLNPDGSTRILEAPMTFVGPPGRKFGVILEDTIWQNVYPTDETDIDKLEEMFLVKPQFWQDHLKAIAAPREDYKLLLAEIGMTEEQVQADIETGETIPMPREWCKAVVRNSPIAGKGFFATVPMREGETIAPARIGDKKTPAGRYTNHSNDPNAVLLKADDGNLYLVAARPIKGCMGGGMGEEITLDYRQAMTVGGTK